MRKILRADVLGALALALFLGAGAPDSPVADRAMRGDMEGIQALIAQGADVNAPQADGMTALHWAALNGSMEIARMLVASGANLEAVTRLGNYTPLHLSSQSGRSNAVQLLLEAGASANPRTTTGGVTPLHLAADAGVVESVVALIAHGAEVNARETEWGHTPLMFAAAAGRTEAARVLLSKGADPAITASVIDMVERARMDKALETRRNKLLAALQASGQISRAALAQSSYRHGNEQAAGEGAVATASSSAGGQYDAIERLIGRYGGLTALLLAARDGNLETAVALLDGGAEINQPSAGDHTTPLLLASINGHFDLAMMLLQKGADPRLQSDAGATPLYVTINTQWIPKSRHPQPADYMQQRTTHLELMEALLKAGADPNVRLKYKVWYSEYSREFQVIDWIGATPFFRAAHALDVPAMRLLIEHGADPNIPTMNPQDGGFRITMDKSQVKFPMLEKDQGDPSGLPPIPIGGPGVYPIHAATGVGYILESVGNTHRYVDNGWLAAAKFLIEELGADPNQRDLDGYTPLHHAAARGDNELIKYLLSKGADPFVVARSGQTVVDAANGPHNDLVPFLETVRMLEAMGVKNNHWCASC